MDNIGIVHGEGFELYVAQVSLNLAFLQILGFGMSSLSPHYYEDFQCNYVKVILTYRQFQVGGIEVIENMPHCINNCYDLEGFWKSWHASYNRWLVRYGCCFCVLLSLKRKKIR